MIFAQFYHRAVWPAGTDKIIEACGDRSVVVLDGRYTVADNLALTRSECAKRGYIGYALHKGETFTRSARITSIVKL